jgi:hypothetical protein
MDGVSSFRAAPPKWCEHMIEEVWSFTSKLNTFFSELFSRPITHMTLMDGRNVLFV